MKFFSKACCALSIFRKSQNPSRPQQAEADPSSLSKARDRAVHLSTALRSLIDMKIGNIRGFLENDRFESITKMAKRMLYHQQRGNSPFFLFSVKVAICAIFVIGVVASLYAEDVGTVSPIHASEGEEIFVEKRVEPTSPLPPQLFANSRLNTSIASLNPEYDKRPPIGGPVDPTLATAQGSTFLVQNMAVPPEIPSQERGSITTYIVKPGDTPGGIARAFGLSLETLLWSNDLDSPNLVHPGDKLTILPIDGLQYEVQPGDTISSIARKFKADPDKLLAYNDIASSEHIIAGQTLIIPEGVKPAPAPRRNAPAPRGSLPRYAASLQNLDSAFIRPTIGYISQRLHGHNGIDIAGGCRQPVYAAAAGTVGVAVGNGRWNGGYGNYVTISHPNSTSTLYAHFSQVVVSSGQAVGQGQLIGYTGSTGRSSGCHVHWEVHGARNPLAY